MNLEKRQSRNEYEEKVEKIILDMKRKGFLGYAYYKSKRKQ